MIKTTMGALVSAERSLDHLLTVRCAAKTAYRIAKMTRVVRQETSHFHEEQRKLFAEFGVERETVTPAERSRFGERLTQVPVERMSEFAKRMKELTDIPVDLALEPLVLDELTISGADILSLGPLAADVDA
jgi:hypothetical protein